MISISESSSRKHTGDVYVDLCRYAEALENYREALSIWDEYDDNDDNGDDKHNDTQCCCNNSVIVIVIVT